MKTIIITLLFAITATFVFGQSKTTPEPRKSRKSKKTVVIYEPAPTYVTYTRYSRNSSYSVSRPVANWRSTRAAYQYIKSK